jgi:hypothetical protein
MITVGNGRKEHIHFRALACPGDEKSWASEKMICWQASSVSHQLLTVTGNSERILFLNDQCGNVIENKGPLWKTRRKAGMFMKRKVLSSIRRESC